MNYSVTTKPYDQLSYQEKCQAASELQKITHKIDEARSIIQETMPGSPEALERHVTALTEEPKSNSLLQRIIILFRETIQTESFINFVTGKLRELELSIQENYNLIVKSEMLNWGSPLVGKETSFIPKSISKAQREILALLQQYTKEVEQLEQRIDFVTDPLTFTCLKNNVTTGVDTRSCPFILIKAKSSTNGLPDADTLIRIRLEFTNSVGEVLESPNCRVIGDAAGMFGSCLTTEELKTKLQEFFEKGLEFHCGSIESTLQPWKAS